MSGVAFDHGAERRPVLSTRVLTSFVVGALVIVGGSWYALRGGAAPDDGAHGRRHVPDAELTRRALLAAAAEGDLEAVEHELSRGADPAARDEQGRSALSTALAAAAPEVARRLLRAGAPVDAGRDDSAGDLALAVGLDDAFLVAQLVVAGARTDARDREGASPLHLAADAGASNSAAALLDAHADPEARDRLGMTPLARAALLARADTVRLLLARGANARALDDRGRGVLQLACAAGDPETVRELFAAGVDPRVADQGGWTPLHEAAALGRLAVLRELLPRLDRAAMDARTARGASALHLAARRGDARSVALFLDAGLDPAATDGAGRTPRDLAPPLAADPAWARLGAPTARREVPETALNDAAARRPELFWCTRRIGATPEERIALELAAWTDGAVLVGEWRVDGSRELVAGVLEPGTVEAALADLEDAGWFDDRLASLADHRPRAEEGARSDQVEWIVLRGGVPRQCVWDSLERTDDPSRGASPAWFAAWTLSRTKSADILRGIRPVKTRGLQFVVTPDRAFRGISFEHGVAAPWIE